MKSKEEAKAWAIVSWFVASFVLLAWIYEEFHFSCYGLPVIGAFAFFALSARCVIRNADLIDNNINMID